MNLKSTNLIVCELDNIEWYDLDTIEWAGLDTIIFIGDNPNDYISVDLSD